MADGDGYGQLRPEVTASEYASLVFVIQSQLAKLDTVKIVKVQAVDADAKTVQVMPLVEQTDGNNQVTPQGTIYGVPYMQWQYGTNAVLADPAVGDIGMLLCSDRDISAVKESKDAAPPGSERKYDRADGVYLGGVLNGTPDQYVKFTDDGVEITAKGSHTLKSTQAGGWQVDKLTVTGNLQLGGNIVDDGGGTYTGDIHTSGTVTGDTDVVSGTIHLKTHRHTGVTTGGGTSGGPTP